MFQSRTMRVVRLAVAFASIVLMFVLAVACGSGGSGDLSEVTLPTPDSSVSGGDGATPFHVTGNDSGFMVAPTTTSDAGDGAAAAPSGPLTISPLAQTISVAYGQQTPGLTFEASIGTTV